MREEALDGLLAERDGLAAGARGREDVPGEDRDVLAALAERRHRHRHDGEPEIKVLAEFPAGHLALQIALGRGDDAHVGLDRFVAADAAKLARLEDAQELGLHVEREIADFVEEHRAALGELERALARGDRARERAALVAEELALDERVAHRAAVDDDERLALSRRVLDDGAREDVLAGARLALEEHGALGRRDALEHAEDAAHGEALPERGPEARLLAREDLGFRRGRAERDLDLADLEHGARREERVRDARAVDARAVRRAEIAHADCVALSHELAVVARDRVVSEDEVVVVRLAEARAIAELDLRALARAREDHERERAARERETARRARLDWGVAHRAASAASIDVLPPSR